MKTFLLLNSGMDLIQEKAQVCTEICHFQTNT